MKGITLRKLHPSRYNHLMRQLNDPEIQEQIRQSRIITLTDIEHIKVQPAYQPDELAIEIASKDGRKVHILVQGHFA